ncbi:hypothetical protein [Pseudoalteromonas xiamenensis]|uniref:Uncharacterized protein n=1 Tax=Pseudoalteromonas xiamenensis TaxID=882626 RepID=A0A975DJ85_9GAMM|nr:hypothetical protein [Pseudoalteromonas xiamenensis]QTH71301.1 hypothetical protein J5O05_16160 [Pseudoalteromonas xiamenensis]
MFEPNPMPKSLHEVFGKQQSPFEITATLIFGVVGTLFIWLYFYTPWLETNTSVSPWRVVIAYIILADVLCGCLANFTRGTNRYYMENAKSRWWFIASHVHILLFSLLLNAFFLEASSVWLVTILTATLVNLLNGHRLQLFVAGLCLAVGLLFVSALDLPRWMFVASFLFMTKVAFSFPVVHYPNERE